MLDDNLCQSQLGRTSLGHLEHIFTKTQEKGEKGGGIFFWGGGGGLFM